MKHTYIIDLLSLAVWLPWGHGQGPGADGASGSLSWTHSLMRGGNVFTRQRWKEDRSPPPCLGTSLLPSLLSSPQNLPLPCFCGRLGAPNLALKALRARVKEGSLQAFLTLQVHPRSPWGWRVRVRRIPHSPFCSRSSRMLAVCGIHQLSFRGSVCKVPPGAREQKHRRPVLSLPAGMSRAVGSCRMNSLREADLFGSSLNSIIYHVRELGQKLLSSLWFSVQPLGLLGRRTELARVRCSAPRRPAPAQAPRSSRRRRRRYGLHVPDEEAGSES